MGNFFCRLFAPWKAESCFDDPDDFYDFLLRRNRALNAVRVLFFAAAAVCLMLGYGMVCLLLLFAVSYGGFLWGLSGSFPREVVGAWFVTILPHVLGGFASYLLAAWIILEPVWSQRLYNAVIGLLVLSVFMIQGVPGSHACMYPFLFGTLVLLALYPKISIRHFKEGMQ